MQMSGNTILITGGGTGIGRGLAEAFHARGNRVVIAGRSRETLAATATANPGMAFEVMDIADTGSIQQAVTRILTDHPQLNVLINNAGMLAREDATADPVDSSLAAATVTTNLLGPIRLTAALLPHLRRQSAAAVLNVTSGLAFVPAARIPTYCASKAALHSYTQSLRFQLRDTPIQVIELAPPLVATDLQPAEKSNPRAMPLHEYIDETIALLAAEPAPQEILVERVKRQRFAEARGDFADVFAMLNTSGR